MRKPLEKVAKALLRYPKTKRFVQTRDQSVAVQSNPRSLPLEPLQVECPFNSQLKNHVEPQKPTVEKNRSTLPPSDGSSSRTIRPFSSIPSPPGLPLVGSLFEFIKAGAGSNLHEYNRMRHSQLGPIYKENIAGHEVLYVSDPELYRDVTRFEGSLPLIFKPDSFKLYHNETNCVRNNGLFFKEGTDWWSLRKSLNNVMLKRLNCNKTLPAVMTSYEELLTEVLHEWDVLTRSNSGSLPNVEKELFRLGFTGSSRVVLGHQFVKNWAKLNKDLNFVMQAAEGVTKGNQAMISFPAALAKKLGTKTWKNFEKSMADLVQSCKDIATLCAVDTVKQASRPDFGHREGGILYRAHTEANIPLQSLVDLAVGFLATPDPITATLKWVIYSLGRHPELQERINKEIQQVCGSNTPVTQHHVDDLKLVKMSLKETLRLYPSAPFMARNLPEESVIGSYRIPAGLTVALSVYTSQRDPKYFQNPLHFWPERWARISGENSGALQPLTGVLDTFAFRPFGFGKRSCLGKVFAESMMHLFIARTIQQFKVHSEEVQPTMKTMLLPDRPLEISLVRRETAL